MTFQEVPTTDTVRPAQGSPSSRSECRRDSLNFDDTVGSTRPEEPDPHKRTPRASVRKPRGLGIVPVNDDTADADESEAALRPQTPIGIANELRIRRESLQVLLGELQEREANAGDVERVSALRAEILRLNEPRPVPADPPIDSSDARTAGSPRTSLGENAKPKREKPRKKKSPRNDYWPARDQPRARRHGREIYAVAGMHVVRGGLPESARRTH